MKTLTEKLADALRAVLPFAERDVGELTKLANDGDSESEAMAANADVERAAQTLADYDARQPAPSPVEKLAAALREIRDRHPGTYAHDTAAMRSDDWECADKALADYDATVLANTSGLDAFTATPWVHDGENAEIFARVGSDVRRIASCPRAENARRIVACVNACAGVATDALESFGAAGLGSNKDGK